MIFKKALKTIGLLSFIQVSYACEFITETEEGYSFKSVKCGTSVLRSELNSNSEIETISDHINITTNRHRGIVEKIELSKMPFVINKISSKHLDNMDLDDRFFSGVMLLNKKILPGEIIELEDYYQNIDFDNLDSDKITIDSSKKKIVYKVGFDTQRTLAQILAFLDIKEFKEIELKDDKLSYIKQISNPNRYIDYLSKYPLSEKTESQYTQMAAFLIGYKLYREALLVSANLDQFNSNNINAKLALADAYYHLDKKTKAKSIYKDFLLLAEKQKVKPPVRALNRIQ